MIKLVRTALKRQVEFEGRLYLIRPPVVREAAEILASATGYIATETTHTAGFRDAVARWLPVRLAWDLLMPALPRVAAVNILMQWLMEGIDLSLYKKKEIEKAKEVSEESSLDRILKLDLDDMLAEYAYAYKIDPFQAYCTVPWTMFLQFHRLSERMSSRALLRSMVTNNIANIKDEFERKEAFKDLKMAAGFEEKEMTREERIARGKRNLEKVANMLTKVDPNTETNDG